MPVITLAVNRTGKATGRRKRPRLDVLLRMCEQIARFMEQNNGSQFQAYFSRDGGTVGLYLVTTSETYDFALGDKLAEFAAPYIERGLLGSVTLLPDCTSEELAAYFEPALAVQVEIRHA